jgi:hypothetical protein
MVETAISQLEVVVTGGPRTVKVDADFGPQGQRGSLILYGYGAPEDNVQFFTQVPQILDWYINLDPAHPEYLYIYQYVDMDAGLVWKPFIKIFPNTYNANVEVEFDETGTAEFDLNVGNASLPYLLQFIGSSSAIGQKFNIQVNIPNENPVAASIYFGADPDNPDSTPVINENEEYVLPIKIHAAEVDFSESGYGGAWNELTGTKIVHISINMI